MKRWTHIKYREFYDLPRIFLAEIGNRIFLFDCRFNEEKDEYEQTYKVYLMPQLDEKELAGSWENLPARATTLLGEIPTSEIEFDTTLRQEVNLGVLSRFGF
jgi:N-acyl-L-homoserine lactone synthetase